MNFNIRQDLQHRPLSQQVEILWISGPTYHDAEKIAAILGIDSNQVMIAVRKLEKLDRQFAMVADLKRTAAARRPHPTGGA